MSERTQGESFQTDIYSWGDNTYQQLGYKTNYTPESGYTSSPTPLAIEALSGKPTIQIASGASHSMALTVDGSVYCWGRNNSYQCGNGSNTFNSAPLVVEKLKGKKVTQIACGNSHSIAVTDTDEVYVWGSNCYYQLSIVHYKTPDLIRSQFLEGKRIARVACGANFTSILTSSGEIFSWGSNTKGELGIGSFCNTASPQPVRLEAKSVWIDCGYSHSTAVTADGRLYTWGSNDNSQLGFTQHHLNMSTPQLVSCLIDKAVKKSVCGSFYTMCITEDGKLFAWGCNTSYELGLGHTNRVSSPTIVHHLQDRIISEVYCGKAHTIATTEDGLVYGWGANSYSQVTASSVGYVPIPKLLSHLHTGGEIISLCCGDFQTYLLTELIEPSTFQMDFENALNNPQYSDVTFIAQGKKIYAHKFVLLTRCEYFVHLFKHQMRESQTNEIRLDETTYPAAYAFLEYLYTDKLNLATEYAVELYNLANMYNVERLKKLCDQSIRKNLTLDNCVVVFRAAYGYRVDTISQHCANFILTHLGALVKTDDFQDLAQEEMLAILKQVPQHCSIDL